MVKKKVTWVAVLDGEKALFLTMNPQRHLYNLDIEIEKTPDASDRGGQRNLRRVHDRVGPQRHISKPRKNEKAYQHKLFIESVADFLDHALMDKKYDRLILVAPAKVLGRLRKSLSICVHNVISLEYEKDYVNHAPHEIQQHLEQITFL